MWLGGFHARGTGRWCSVGPVPVRYCTDAILYLVDRQQGNPGLTNECGPNLRSRRNAFWSPTGGWGGKGLSGDVDEADANSHSLCQTGVEGTDLRMDVGKKSKTRPSSDFHYQRVLYALEFQSHCPGCPEGMGANALEIVALVDQIRINSGLVNQSGNMCSHDMDAGLYEAERGGSRAVLATDA
jgi:hypothetical protein